MHPLPSRLQISDEAADDLLVDIASANHESAIVHRSRKLVVIGIQSRLDCLPQLIGGVGFYRDDHRRAFGHRKEFNAGSRDDAAGVTGFPRRYNAFAARGTVRPPLAGIERNLVSPTGHVERLVDDDDAIAAGS